jgi:hypothetical protein
MAAPRDLTASTIDCVNVRRALLLFAIVLALAAAAATLSNPRHDKTSSAPAGSLAVPGASAEERSVKGEGVVDFSTARPRTHRVPSGRATTVRVHVQSAGQVQIRGLGESAPADSVTPALFDLFPDHPGRYPVEFTPAASDSSESVGTLVAVGPSS